MQKTKITRERHIELGDELHAMAEAITNLVAELSGAVPRISAAYASARKTSSALLALRSDLENLMLREHPDRADDLRIYFGQRVVKTASHVASSQHESAPHGVPR